jgi:hypothetical protein
LLREKYGGETHSAEVYGKLAYRKRRSKRGGRAVSGVLGRTSMRGKVSLGMICRVRFKRLRGCRETGSGRRTPR